jgi:hypothetical protein
VLFFCATTQQDYAPQGLVAHVYDLRAQLEEASDLAALSLQSFAAIREQNETDLSARLTAVLSRAGQSAVPFVPQHTPGTLERRIEDLVVALENTEAARVQTAELNAQLAQTNAQHAVFHRHVQPPLLEAEAHLAQLARRVAELEGQLGQAHAVGAAAEQRAADLEHECDALHHSLLATRSDAEAVQCVVTSMGFLFCFVCFVLFCFVLFCFVLFYLFIYLFFWALKMRETTTHTHHDFCVFVYFKNTNYPFFLLSLFFFYRYLQWTASELQQKMEAVETRRTAHTDDLTRQLAAATAREQALRRALLATSPPREPELQQTARLPQSTRSADVAVNTEEQPIDNTKQLVFELEMVRAQLRSAEDRSAAAAANARQLQELVTKKNAQLQTAEQAASDARAAAAESQHTQQQLQAQLQEQLVQRDAQAREVAVAHAAEHAHAESHRAALQATLARLGDEHTQALVAERRRMVAAVANEQALAQSQLLEMRVRAEKLSQQNMQQQRHITQLLLQTEAQLRLIERLRGSSESTAADLQGLGAGAAEGAEMGPSPSLLLQSGEPSVDAGYGTAWTQAQQLLQQLQDENMALVQVGTSGDNF